MKILIDADGCPVVDLTVKIAAQTGTECIILCDTSHYFEKEGAKTVTVSKGADSADFALVNMIEKNDIAVTQDYGLAAMCLAKSARVINQDGMIYNDGNIMGLLNQRAAAKKIRMSGGRLKGPSKRIKSQDEKFTGSLCELLENQKN